MTIKTLLPKLLFLLMAATVFGQPSYRYFDTFHEMQIRVNCVFQDQAGYIWIGSQDGLFRYNGQEFMPVVFPGNSRPIIEAIETGQNGVLWIGAREDGLFRYDENGEIRQFLNESGNAGSLPDNRIRSLKRGETGDLWVGTSSGLSVMSGDVFEKVELGDGPSRINTMSVVNDAILVGARSGLYLVSEDDKKATALFTIDSVNAFLKTKDGGWLLGTNNGLWQAPAGSWNLTPLHADLGMILSMAHGPDGRIWVGCTSGLYILDSAGIEPVHPTGFQSGNLLSNRISDLLCDHNRSIWIATDGGLNHYDPLANRFNQYTQIPKDPRSLSAPRVRCMFQDSRDILWIGTLGGGLNRLDPGTDHFTVLKHIPDQPGSLNSDLVYCVTEDLKGRLWVGSNRGLHRMDKPGDPFKLYMDSGREGSLKNNQIRALYVDPSGILWVGAKTGGFYRYEEEKDHFTQITGQQNWISRVYAYQISQDKNGYIWVSALDQGLLRYHKGTGVLKNFRYEADDPNSLSNNVSFAFATDEQENFWVGTGKGLNLYVPETENFKRFSPDAAILDVMGLVADMKGHLWISCKQGIYRFHISSETWRLFQVRSQPEGFNHSASFRDGDGRIFFGGNWGYNAFHPKEAQKKQKVPRPVVHTIKVDNQALSPPLKLSWNNRLISFGFSALHYTDANLVRYAYQLEGVDEEWQMGDMDRKDASYGKLPGGFYQFRVKAENSDGMWSKASEPVNVRVSVKPWISWWAWSGYGLVLFLLIKGITRYNNRRLHRRNLILERRVLNRTQALEKAQSELLEQAHAAGRAEIAVSTLHNVGNVLNSMNISSQQLFELSVSDLSSRFIKANDLLKEILEKQLNDPKCEKLHKYFDLLILRLQDNQGQLHENVNRIREKVELLRAFIRSQDGLEIHQKSEKLELNELLGEALDMMSEVMKHRQIEINHESKSPVHVMGRRSKLFQILLEVFNNAIEAMMETRQPRLTLTVGQDHKQGFIRIQDTGVGFEPDQSELIFNLGVTTKENHNGFSLHLAANDMIIMKGGIYAESEGPGKGAVFTLKLPLHEES